MEINTFSGKTFRATRAWDAITIARFTAETTVRLHWTDQPYRWHSNDGQEVFVVLDGVVDMHFKKQGAPQCVRLTAGEIFYADEDCEHKAHPQGEARVRVIENAGSI